MCSFVALFVLFVLATSPPAHLVCFYCYMGRNSITGWAVTIV